MVSYGEVVLATLGPGGQRLVEALLIISQTGALTASPPSTTRIYRSSLTVTVP